ncbi:Superfamily II DNA or RNA helicase [Jatrophihabitans endophyticus]|uniref:Superfamily II DNA or RNA helicase n=1 Tax=Jatrophihabitans endophyticus TaxID=1206085 RepID=A0A1M5M4P7_9ACTN|nr:DEAD/DEAH box helicase family protein [Jatrophihabitans endophyticus]SHG72284.1 Superfamily II DNA or RNA helicase [Jatrophihabitans endophyticus]
MAAPHQNPPHDAGRTVGPRLRAWQRTALAAYREVPRRRDFLVTATPGAGKTTFALALARGLVDERVIDRVVVVCPTDHLRTQWAEAADRLGLPLDPTLSNAVGPVRPDLRGYVTTYAQVAAKPALHAARTGAKRTLVVLDEVHHAGDGLSWGDAVATAFELAARRVCLTGTPFRTRPDERIPFVRYDEDVDGGWRSSADYTYGYREALADGVVRPVVFAAYTGTSRWRNSAGEVVAASLSQPNTRSVEATAWKTALDPRGKWVPHVIAAMDERITHLRATGVPDAAGLVLASDQDDARAYAGIVEQVTGEAPVVILSDDPKASDKITAFTHGTQRIAVCVRMVSEGVDVPRAACLAWMTSYRTPLFFAQGVGRVVRARAPGETATVFLPAVRPLLTLAAELEQDRNHVIPPPAQQDETILDVERVEPEPGERERTELVDVDASFAHVLHGGRAVVAAPLTDDDEDFLGLPGILTPEQTAELLMRRDSHARQRAAGTTAPEPSAEATAWRAGAELRREVNRLVAVYSARTGTPHRQVHAEVRRAVPGPASAAASADVLERRRDHLMALLGGRG